MGFALEDQLILQCARVQMDEPIRMAVVDLLHKDLDWEYILEATILHCVAPLLYRSLTQLASIAGDIRALVPDTALKELERLYNNNVLRNRRLYRVAGEIFTTFKKANIQAMGLKDLPLTRKIFPDIGLRPMGDLDILIHPEDYARAEACMMEIGFVPLPDADSPLLKKYAWGLAFRRPSDNVWVDLQWGVMQLEWDVCGEASFDFEIDRMWQGARVLALDDFEMLEPSPEDMLFHLCMHLEGHHYAELILFCDIAEYIRQYGSTLDWEHLIALAKKYRVETSIYYTFFFTQWLFGCPLPFSLPDFAPTYFKANVFEPLFGNSAALHDTLDDIYHLATPLPETMEHFERLVRRQTASAMKWYAELDHLVTTLKGYGAGVILVDGDSSPMVLPSAVLPAFANTRLFILNEDRPRLERALQTCGYIPDPSGQTGTYDKTITFASCDPALKNMPLQLAIHAQFVEGLDMLLGLGQALHWTKKGMAFKAVMGALRPSAAAPVSRAPFSLVVLSPEEMLVYLGLRFKRHQYERLFGMGSVFEFFRLYRGQVDWEKTVSIAKGLKLEREMYESFSLAIGEDSSLIPGTALAQLGLEATPPRIFEWARYGQDSMVLYTQFKSLVFCLLSLFSIRRLRDRLRYLFGKTGRAQQRSVWRRCVEDIAHLSADWLTAMFKKKQLPTPLDFAYWTETESVTSDNR